MDHSKSRCGASKFCVAVGNDNKIYCNGSNGGCLWNENTCNEDSDCVSTVWGKNANEKKNALVAKYPNFWKDKYTDGATCETATGWAKDACNPRSEVYITRLNKKIALSYIITSVKDTVNEWEFINNHEDYYNWNDNNTNLSILSNKNDIPLGFPVGFKNIYTWTKPDDFGITYNGIDISNYYEAYHHNYDTSRDNIPIPSNCIAMKVVLLNGGEAGIYDTRISSNLTEYGKPGRHSYYYVACSDTIRTFNIIIGNGTLTSKTKTRNRGGSTQFIYDSVIYFDSETSHSEKMISHTPTKEGKPLLVKVNPTRYTDVNNSKTNSMYLMMGGYDYKDYSMSGGLTEGRPGKARVYFLYGKYDGTNTSEYNEAVEKQSVIKYLQNYNRNGRNNNW